MGDELGTLDGGSNGSTPAFAGIFLFLEDKQHQTRGIVLNNTVQTKVNVVVGGCDMTVRLRLRCFLLSLNLFWSRLSRPCHFIISFICFL